jgi:hypothetical protein
MKLLPILILACLSLFTLNQAKTVHKKTKNKSTHMSKIRQDPSKMNDINTTPKHISEVMYGGAANTLPKYRHFLWKDFTQNKYERPYYHGVVGPQFPIPYSIDSTPYHHISSPTPHNDYSERIIAKDLPEKTFSHSSFDLPNRQDVVQVDIPVGITRTIQSHIDPRFPPKKEVSVSHGTLYHNTGSVNADINHGYNEIATAENNQTKQNQFSFLEKKGRKKRVEKNESSTEVEKLRAEALNYAQDAERRASRLMENIQNTPEGKIILDIKTTNKRDNDIGLYKNAAATEHIKKLRNHPIGIMALNTKTFLPPRKRPNEDKK